MTVCRAKGCDRRIMHNLHLVRKFDARRVIDAIRRELVDEGIASEDHRGDAERQIQLRGGEAFGAIGPAGMINGDDACTMMRSTSPAMNGCRLLMSASASRVVWVLPTQA